MSVYDLIKEYGIEKYQVIDEEALEAITLGSSILATGGGGDPQIGLLWTKKVLKDGYEMVMVDPMDMPDDIIACHAGCLGSPLVLTEKPLSDEVLIESFEALQRYMGKRVGATIPIECGGINSVLSYGVAAKYGVPIVDADGMNRAFPEVQMTSWHTHGLRATPAAVCDNNGTVVVVDTKDDNYLAESICRRTAMTYGGISWTSLYPISMGDAKGTSVLYSQSIAWEIGKAVMKARREHLSPIEELQKAVKRVRGVDALRVFQGKVVDIIRDFGSETSKGFTMGRLVLEGINDFKDKTATIDFQNEWLIARIDGEPVCLPPDLIALLDTETGEPIRSDIVKYGYRGTMLVMPVHERMLTPKGLETFGPRAFGYDIDYVPVYDLTGHK